MSRQPPVLATADTDPQVLSEVRQELNQTMEGQALLSQQLKDALNRIAAAKPTRKANGRETIRTKVDSGACEPVLNPEVAVDYPLEETEASRKGVAFVSASGDPMPQLGKRTLVVKMPSGALMSFTNQVCQCTGPLTSVAKMVDADNFVGFSTAGSFILNMRTGAIDWMERKDDCFELELEVLPYAEAAPMLEKAGVPGRP